MLKQKKSAVLLAAICATLVGTTMAPASAGTTPATAVTTKLPAYIPYLGDAYINAVSYRSVAGTATNLTDGKVDLVCINVTSGDVSMTFQRNIAVTAGKWSSYIDISYVAYYPSCRVAAVPTGFNTTGSSAAEKLASAKAFTGPVINVYETRWYYRSLGTPTDQWPTEVGFYYQAKKAYQEMWASEDGGIWKWYPKDGSGNSGPNVVRGFFYRDSGSATGPTGSTDANLTVDGVQAFTPYNVNYYDMNFANKANAPKLSVVVDPKTGASTYTESYALFKCTKPEAGQVYGRIGNCPDSKTTKLGVTWTRTLKSNADGIVVNITDTFASIDKKAHTIRFDQHFDVWTSGNMAYRYAKTGAFGSALTAPVAKAGGFGVKYDNTAATSFNNPIVQVVFGTVPVSSWVSGSSTYSRWNISIPKGKSTTLKSGATIITDDTKAAAQIALAAK